MNLKVTSDFLKAVHQEDIEKMEIILRNGYTVNHFLDSSGGNALLLAATHNLIFSGKFLIEKGSNPSERRGGWSPLRYAMETKRTKWIYLFVKYGKRMDEKDQELVKKVSFRANSKKCL